MDSHQITFTTGSPDCIHPSGILISENLTVLQPHTWPFTAGRRELGLPVHAPALGTWSNLPKTKNPRSTIIRIEEEQISQPWFSTSESFSTCHPKFFELINHPSTPKKMLRTAGEKTPHPAREKTAPFGHVAVARRSSLAWDQPLVTVCSLWARRGAECGRASDADAVGFLCQLQWVYMHLLPNSDCRTTGPLDATLFILVLKP